MGSNENRRTKIGLRAALLPLAFAAIVCLSSPAQAQDAQNNTPQAAPPGSGADNGNGQGDAWPDPFQSRQNARQRNAAQQPRAPLPDYAPQLEKRGEDLIVHAPGGDVEFPAFLHGLHPGEQRSVNVITTDHGNCVLQVDVNATVVSMTCEK